MVAIIVARTVGQAHSRACTSAAPCAVRAISSSVRARRGISIGQGSAAGAGAGAGTSIGTTSSSGGETFSALRRQLRDVKGDAKSAGPAGLAGEKHAERPQTSAQARLQAIGQDGQVDKTNAAPPKPSSAPAPALAPRQATPPQIKEPKTPAAAQAPQAAVQDDSWGALTRRIEQARQGKANEAAASKLSAAANAPQSKGPQSSAAQIDSIPLWSVSVHGVHRSFAFTSAIKARMFLQGVSSALLVEDGWMGTLSLQRGSQAHAKETVDVVLAGSQPSGEADAAVDDALATSSVSEHDVSLAESLDSLYASLSPSAAKGAGKSVAFSNTAGQPSFSTASVLETSHAAQTDRMEERVPVNVTGTE